MKSKLQDLTFAVYPPFSEPKTWNLRGYIFGVWAAHEHHPDEAPPDNWPSSYWCISHTATGLVAFISKRFDMAIVAAKRLAELEPPTVIISHDEDGFPTVQPLPIQWIEQAAQAVAGLDVWASSGGALYTPSELVDRIRDARAKKGDLP